MPDYGMLSSGLSSFHPLTRNPWDLTRNPGGSSAGAGALAAACCGPLHLGTDIGGSVRLPAGWCGIFALKPSGGRVPIDPPYIGRVAGPMTRNVADAALMMATLAQPDARDFMSLPPQRLDWRVAPAKLAGLRIGVLLEAGCFATLPSTLEAAPSPALAERSGAPSGLRPSTFVMSDTPVEVQFTSAGCLNYPCRTQAPRGRSGFTGPSTLSRPFPNLQRIVLIYSALSSRFATTQRMPSSRSIEKVLL